MKRTGNAETENMEGSGAISRKQIKITRQVPMSRLKTIVTTYVCLLYSTGGAHWRPQPEIPSQFHVASTSEPTGGSRNPDNATTGDAIPAGDLRLQGDDIIRGFERELVKMREEIVTEAEDLMLSICEAALERRRVELRDRHRLARSVDDDEDDVI